MRSIADAGCVVEQRSSARCDTASLERRGEVSKKIGSFPPAKKRGVHDPKFWLLSEVAGGLYPWRAGEAMTTQKLIAEHLDLSQPEVSALMAELGINWRTTPLEQI